jgi:hypothetical protein
MNHSIIALTLCVFVSLLFSNESSAKKAPTVQQGPNAEVTFDGLHRVNKSKMDYAWIKPNIDLSQYDTLVFEGAGIQYRSVGNYRRHDRSANAFPLSEKQKAKLEKSVKDAFSSEFKKFKNYEVVATPKEGALKVTLALIDVVSSVPPQSSGRNSFYLRDLGQATLVVELRDAVSNEALARLVDRTRVEPMTLQESNPVTNLNEVKRSVRRWGATIRNRLDQLHELGCYICEVPSSSE